MRLLRTWKYNIRINIQRLYFSLKGIDFRGEFCIACIEYKHVNVGDLVDVSYMEGCNGIYRMI